MAERLEPVSASWRAVVDAVKAAGAEVRAKREQDDQWAAAAVYAQMLADAEAAEARQATPVEPVS